MRLIFNPSNLLSRAVRGNFITQEQSDTDKFKDVAQEVAEEFSSDWEEGQGFGSSDMTVAVGDLLDLVGIQNGYVNGRLIAFQDKDLPKNLVTRKSNADRILKYPLTIRQCIRALHQNEVEGEGGNTIGYDLQSSLTRRQHTQIGDIAVDLGRFYTSL